MVEEENVMRWVHLQLGRKCAEVRPYGPANARILEEFSAVLMSADQHVWAQNQLRRHISAHHS